MHENHLAKPRKNQIGAPRQLVFMQAITIAHAMNKAAHHHFWSGILAADTAHAFASFGGGQVSTISLPPFSNRAELAAAMRVGTYT